MNAHARRLPKGSRKKVGKANNRFRQMLEPGPAKTKRNTKFFLLRWVLEKKNSDNKFSWDQHVDFTVLSVAG